LEDTNDAHCFPTRILPPAPKHSGDTTNSNSNSAPAPINAINIFSVKNQASIPLGDSSPLPYGVFTDIGLNLLDIPLAPTEATPPHPRLLPIKISATCIRIPLTSFNGFAAFFFFGRAIFHVYSSLYISHAPIPASPDLLLYSSLPPGSSDDPPVPLSADLPLFLHLPTMIVDSLSLTLTGSNNFNPTHVDPKASIGSTASPSVLERIGII